MAWVIQEELAGYRLAYPLVTISDNININNSDLRNGNSPVRIPITAVATTADWYLTESQRVHISLSSGRCVQDSPYGYADTQLGSNVINNYDIGLEIDEDAHQARFMGYTGYSHYSQHTQMYRTYYLQRDRTDRENLYTLIKSLPPVYNWQSVPSISGKNGILTLSTLNDINDGEEVTTSDTTKFTLASASNVGKLIEAIVNE